ncbi:MAG: hypothetical protein V4538_17365 [Bacteroidota bacterium]
MIYVCTNARFFFWNGIDKMFTVEFNYGVATWYIFKDEQTSGAIFYKKVLVAKSKTPNRDLAKEILDEYLQTL